MNRNVIIYPLLFVTVVIFSISCKGTHTNDSPADAVEIRTPVTVTSVSNEPMEEYIELNATSVFLQKWTVRSNAVGYLQTSNVVLNKAIVSGQVLYTLKTKEAESIGNTISVLDTAFKFSGINSIKANGSGFISQVDHQAGDYVQDGEQLAVITDTKSFSFLLNLPYELRPYIQNRKSLEMILPDGEKLTGTISGTMPSMDSGSQTEAIILKVNASHAIPENLVAKVRVIKSAKNNTLSLPKAALLTDETQSDFWVMKMTDTATAVKVVIKKGIETGDRVEIISPIFAPGDKILISGNYGLTDTAKVQVVQQ